MRTLSILSLLPLLTLAAACGGGGGGEAPLLDIPFNPAAFSGHAIDNPLLPLVPGTRTVYEGPTVDGFEHVVIEVTRTTRVVLGITCVELHDVASLDGNVIEDTLDWYAQDVDGNVWYFGEDAKTIASGVVVSTAGSWEAGVAGALPGVVMPADPLLGQTYSQEFAPGVAEDMGTVVGLGEAVVTPLSPYFGCVHTEDFSPLIPGIVDDKFYASGVGFVLEITSEGERLELIAIEAF